MSLTGGGGRRTPSPHKQMETDWIGSWFWSKSPQEDLAAERVDKSLGRFSSPTLAAKVSKTDSVHLKGFSAFLSSSANILQNRDPVLCKSFWRCLEWAASRPGSDY